VNGNQLTEYSGNAPLKKDTKAGLQHQDGTTLTSSDVCGLEATLLADKTTVNNANIPYPLFAGLFNGGPNSSSVLSYMFGTLQNPGDHAWWNGVNSAIPYMVVGDSHYLA
jgi:hypothetical protein